MEQGCAALPNPASEATSGGSPLKHLSHVSESALGHAAQLLSLHGGTHLPSRSTVVLWGLSHLRHTWPGGEMNSATGGLVGAAARAADHATVPSSMHPQHAKAPPARSQTRLVHDVGDQQQQALYISLSHTPPSWLGRTTRNRLQLHGKTGDGG